MMLFQACSPKSINDTDIVKSSYDETYLVEQPKQPRTIRKPDRGMINQRNWVLRRITKITINLLVRQMTQPPTRRVHTPSSFKHYQIKA
jgi:hypothetical protein